LLLVLLKDGLEFVDPFGFACLSCVFDGRARKFCAERPGERFGEFARNWGVVGDVDAFED